MGFVTVNKEAFGMGLPEAVVKAALLEWNPDVHFDMGAALNLWHPYQKSRQNIFYRGNSVTAMDRYTLPEFAVWSQKRDLVEVPTEEIDPLEISMQSTVAVDVKCHKCNYGWRMDTTPGEHLMCPGGCQNIGPSSDTKLFAWSEVPTGKSWVWRKVRDRVILVGWRHTFIRLLHKQIPGITRDRLERKFGVDLGPKTVPEYEIDAVHEDTVLNQQVAI